MLSGAIKHIKVAVRGFQIPPKIILKAADSQICAQGSYEFPYGVHCSSSSSTERCGWQLTKLKRWHRHPAERCKDARQEADLSAQRERVQWALKDQVRRAVDRLLVHDHVGVSSLDLLQCKPTSACQGENQKLLLYSLLQFSIIYIMLVYDY